MMNTSLWIIQVLLATLFAVAGIMKLILSKERLKHAGLTWVLRFPIATIRFIGFAELLGAAGLIFPWLLYKFPIFTPLSAFGLIIIMLLAAVHHFKHNEKKAMMVNMALATLGMLVAVGRLRMLE